MRKGMTIAILLAASGFVAAEESAWTKVAPAFSLMARSPSVPSEPIPERTTPMLCSCWSSASERKNRSIGNTRGDVCGSRCRTPCRIVMSRFGGMT